MTLGEFREMTLHLPDSTPMLVENFITEEIEKGTEVSRVGVTTNSECCSDSTEIRSNSILTIAIN